MRIGRQSHGCSENAFWHKLCRYVSISTLVWHCGWAIVSVSGSDAYPDFSQAPIYDDFFNKLETFRRVHLQLRGLESTKDKLGLRWRLARPEAFLKVTTYGDDTGSADYFPIGSYESDAVKTSGDGDDPFLFEFDVKRILFFKPTGTQGLTCTLIEKCFDIPLVGGDGEGDVLFQFNLGIDDFPAVGSGYVDYRKGTDTEGSWDEIDSSELVFRIKVMEATDHFVDEDELLSAVSVTNNKYQSSGVDYTETVLELSKTGSNHDFQQGIDKALVQSWRHVDGTTVDGAILWVIGRTDAFMHTHVTDLLFLGPSAYFKFDLYVLNWRLNGLAAIERGWLTDPYFNSHNAYGELSVFNEEVQATLDLMKPHFGTEYVKVLGYGHSTGATILLNYILDKGDARFDGLLLNGPFLDLDQACYEEVIAENVYPILIDTGSK